MIIKQRLFRIGDKDFFSVEETGIPLHEMRNHACWIHPKFKEACGLTDEDLEWFKACEMERNFQKAVDMATFGGPKTEKERRFMEKWLYFDPFTMQDLVFSDENDSKNPIHS